MITSDSITKKVSVFTGTRADYGLLYWLMRDLDDDLSIALSLIVSGTHLSHEFGRTIDLIRADGFYIDEEIEMVLSSDSAVGTVKSLAVGLISYAEALQRQKPDLLIVLGDRFEALGAAEAAALMRIPVLHIHGGEVSEGAYDDSIRHAITKFAYIHCVSNEQHRKRVIQLGEDPSRVFVVGAVGLDYISRATLLGWSELSERLGVTLAPKFFLVTYHPVTRGSENAFSVTEQIFLAMELFPEHDILVTYPNADDGGKEIIRCINEFEPKFGGRMKVFPSLGQLCYLSAMALCDVVVGNSSSGILEAPSFNTPTVNVGIRQKGRLAARSVHNVSGEKNAIVQGIRDALESASNSTDSDIFFNPHGEPGASKKILEIVKKYSFSDQKRFFDIDFGEV